MCVERNEITNPIELPVNERLRAAMEKTADQILGYSLDVQPGDNVLIKLSFGEYSHQFCDIVMRKIRERGANIGLQMLTPSMENNAASDKRLMGDVSAGTENFRLPLGVTDFEDDSDQRAAFFHYGPGSDEVDHLLGATKLLIIRTRVGDPTNYGVDPQLEDDMKKMANPLTDWRMEMNSNSLRRWCLIVPPTPEAPTPAGMTAEDFAALYFETCTLDWEEVEKAQDVLAEMLSGKNEIKIEVPAPAGFGPEWNTSITLGTTDQVFANSVARQNMPGAEVFAAPTAQTLNGTFAVPHDVWFINRVLPNLRLEFKEGKVVDWYTDASEEDKAFFASQVFSEKDPGAAVIGEIGFGTNKHVNVPPPDTMLAEKAFGVHLALGNSHAQKKYFGKDVQIDNKNRSNIHVDIPRLMLEAYGGGTITVDGMKIFENGRYLDPRLQVLNP